MKLNIEIKPKEWLLIALFLVIIFLVIKGDVGAAIQVIKLWINK